MSISLNRQFNWHTQIVIEKIDFSEYKENLKTFRQSVWACPGLSAVVLQLYQTLATTSKSLWNASAVPGKEDAYFEGSGQGSGWCGSGSSHVYVSWLWFGYPSVATLSPPTFWTWGVMAITSRVSQVLPLDHHSYISISLILEASQGVGLKHAIACEGLGLKRNHWYHMIPPSSCWWTKSSTNLPN